MKNPILIDNERLVGWYTGETNYKVKGTDIIMVTFPEHPDKAAFQMDAEKKVRQDFIQANAIELIVIDNTNTVWTNLTASSRILEYIKLKNNMELLNVSLITSNVKNTLLAGCRTYSITQNQFDSFISYVSNGGWLTNGITFAIKKSDSALVAKNIRGGPIGTNGSNVVRRLEESLIANNFKI